MSSMFFSAKDESKPPSASELSEFVFESAVDASNDSSSSSCLSGDENFTSLSLRIFRFLGSAESSLLLSSNCELLTSISFSSSAGSFLTMLDVLACGGWAALSNCWLLLLLLYADWSQLIVVVLDGESTLTVGEAFFSLFKRSALLFVSSAGFLLRDDPFAAVVAGSDWKSSTFRIELPFKLLLVELVELVDNEAILLILALEWEDVGVDVCSWFWLLLLLFIGKSLKLFSRVLFESSALAVAVGVVVVVVGDNLFPVLACSFTLVALKLKLFGVEKSGMEDFNAACSSVGGFFSLFFSLLVLLLLLWITLSRSWLNSFGLLMPYGLFISFSIGFYFKMQ